MAIIINGKEIASGIRKEVSDEIKKLKALKGATPKLSVILVGDDPASHSYVRGKEKACEEVGILSETHRFPANIEGKRLIYLVNSLNKNKNVHGILIQLPLPKGLDEQKILNSVSPEKDVDGLHIENMGKLFKGLEALFLPCTPRGIIELVLSTGVEIMGKEVVVVGRSNIVGKPVAIMMLAKHATVTICHSRTVDLDKVCRRADILIAATGKPKLVKEEWIKEGAVVIDVGINRTEEGLVGDVDFEKAKNVAGYISPVPGGVGPMTIAMLLKNTLISAARFSGYHLK